MTRLVLSIAAREDLIDVWEYISLHNSDSADHYVRQLQERARQLLSHPELGRRHDEVAAGVRGLVFHNHILFYVITPDRIEIVRILHGARDLPAAFREPSQAHAPRAEWK